MQKLLFIIFIVFCLFAALAQTKNQEPIQFLGAKACASCHGSDGEDANPFHIWQTSRHSQAFKTLVSCTEDQARDFGDLKLWVVRMGNGTCGEFNFALAWPKIKHSAR